MWKEYSQIFWNIEIAKPITKEKKEYYYLNHVTVLEDLIYNVMYI